MSTSHIHSWVLFLLWLHPFILLELFLHWPPVAYWAPAGLGSTSFSILSFGLFILFMKFSRQEYWSGLRFPSPVDHIPSDLSTMTRPSWVALRAWLSFIELDKVVVLVWLDWLVFCEYGFSVSDLKGQHSENEDHGIQSHHFMGNRWGNSGNSGRLYFFEGRNHFWWWLEPEIKKCLRLGRKVMTNLDSK